ncbi:Ent-copalyl diphosphate synthase 2 [Platanthera guangdongensis]|uniref:Ent-copalyl diphosphate synthase 2 n=1 Tax=Platanthera guangdongensis TaxID=2320717 RepID=A0ABR2M3W7_9ASPA
MIEAYFLAAASIFESDRSIERLTWARTAVLAEAVSSFYSRYTAGDKIMPSFLEGVLARPQNLWPELNRTGETPVDHILGMLCLPNTMPVRKKLLTQAFRRHLRRAWVEWLLKLEEGESVTGWSVRGETSLLLIRTIELCAGRTEPEGDAARLEYAYLARLAASICSRLQVCMWVPEAKKYLSSMEDNEAKEDIIVADRKGKFYSPRKKKTWERSGIGFLSGAEIAVGTRAEEKEDEEESDLGAKQNRDRNWIAILPILRSGSRSRSKEADIDPVCDPDQNSESGSSDRAIMRSYDPDRNLDNLDSNLCIAFATTVEDLGSAQGRNPEEDLVPVSFYEKLKVLMWPEEDKRVAALCLCCGGRNLAR